MTGIATILLVLCGLAWTVAAVASVGSLWRIARRRKRPNDDFLSALFFVALVMVSFNARRVVATDDLPSLGALCTFSLLAAVYTVRVIWGRGHGGI